MRILALSRDIDLDASRQGNRFSVALRKGDVEHILDSREYAALWQLSGARRRNGSRLPQDEIERTRMRLVSAGLLVAIDVRETDRLALEHRVSLADLALPPSLYEVLEGNQRLGFLSSFDAEILGACDGRRDVVALCAWATEHGYEVTEAHILSSLGFLQGANLLSPGPQGRPIRKGVVIRVDAVVARPDWSDVAYLLDPDESELLERCRGGGCSIGALMDDAATEADREWIRAVISKACSLGLATVAADPAGSTPPDFDDLDGATAVESVSMMDDLLAPLAPQPPRLVPAPPRRLTPPAAMQAAKPPTRVTPSQPSPVVPPMRATPSQGLQVTRPSPIPTTPRPGFAPELEVPARAATPPFGIGPPTATPPNGTAGVDPAAHGRLASLASLSLDKTSSAPMPVVRRPTQSSSKLPWVLLVLVVAGGAIYHFKTVNQQPASTTTNGSQDTAVAVPITPRTALLASGYIAAKAPILLSAKASGRLEVLKVDTGHQVKKGQLLAQVSDGPARANLSLARTRARDAQRQLNRTKKLVKAQAATPVELERAVGNVEIAFAEARVAEQALEDTRIRSPIDGTVIEVLIRPGEAVTPGTQGVLRIADLNDLIAEVNVGEAELRQVYPDQDCEVVTDAQRDRVFKGVVREIAEQADRARGTVLVKVHLEPITDSALKPGMAVQVRFLPKRDPEPNVGGSGASAGSDTSAGSDATDGAGAAAPKSAAAGTIPTK